MSKLSTKNLRRLKDVSRADFVGKAVKVTNGVWIDGQFRYIAAPPIIIDDLSAYAIARSIRVIASKLLGE